MVILNETIDHKSHMKGTLKCLFASLSSMFLATLFFQIYYIVIGYGSTDITLILTYTVYYQFQILIMLQLSFACLAVKNRLKILNKHLRFDFQSWDQIGLISLNENENLEKKLSEIILLHERMGFAVTLINKTFTSQVCFIRT